MREVDDNFFEDEFVVLLLIGRLGEEFSHAKFPDIPGAVVVMGAFAVKPAQLEQDFITVGIVPQAFAEKGLGLVGAIEVFAQEKRADGVSFDFLRV